MTKTEILMAYAKGMRIVHPKTEEAYRMTGIIQVKMNGVWTECMTYHPEQYKGYSCNYCRALDDFKKFTTKVGHQGVSGTKGPCGGPHGL